MNNDNVVAFTDENTRKIQELIDQKIIFWYEHVLFSGLWWFSFVLTVLPWVLWVALRKRESTDLLMYSAYFVMVISIVLDVMGDQIGLWYYRYSLIPVLPTYFPWDVTLMPVTIILLIQVRPDINPFIKAVFFALVTSYIGEPIFHWLGVYVPIHWRYTYSVPIQIVIYLMAHYLSRRSYVAPLQI